MMKRRMKGGRHKQKHPAIHHPEQHGTVRFDLSVYRLFVEPVGSMVPKEEGKYR